MKFNISACKVDGGVSVFFEVDPPHVQIAVDLTLEAAEEFAALLRRVVDAPGAADPGGANRNAN